MWSSLSFRQGTTSKFFPPDFIKLSLPCMDISSRVSTQSEEKPGHITTIFFFPSFGKFYKVLSVYGVNQASGPNLD